MATQSFARANNFPNTGRADLTQKVSRIEGPHNARTLRANSLNQSFSNFGGTDFLFGCLDVFVLDLLNNLRETCTICLKLAAGAK